MKQQNYPCLILCAGTSNRFGRDKMFAPLDGKPVLSHVIERMNGQASNLALNAANMDEYAAFNLPVLPDSIGGGLGPLAGVLTAMEWAASLGRSRVLTVSGDTPFVPQDLTARLIEVPKDHIATPIMNDRAQRICSLWPVALASELREFLRCGESLRVKDFISAHRACEIKFEQSNGLNPFFNINTQADLALAESMLNRETSRPFNRQ